jgi:hypothetical protein
LPLSHAELPRALRKIFSIAMPQFSDAFVLFASVCKGTIFSRHIQISCQRIQLNLFKLMSAAEIQRLAKKTGNYFSEILHPSAELPSYPLTQL